MPHLKEIPFQTAVALDQLLSAITGGWADETFSARCWRRRANPKWNRAVNILNALFFWQENHCKTAYESEINRRHLPPSVRAK